MYLPFAAAFAIGIMVASSVTTVIGYYTPVMIVGSILVATGAGLITTFKTDIRYNVPSQFQSGLLLAYNATISEVFYMAVAFGCLTVMDAIGIEWKSVKLAKTAEVSAPNNSLSHPVKIQRPSSRAVFISRESVV
jgi:hypothetical protein